MSEKFLTEDRFQRFEDKFDEYVKNRSERDVKLESRLTVLETNQSHAGWIATWLSGIIATVVTAVLLALANFKKLFGE